MENRRDFLKGAAAVAAGTVLERMPRMVLQSKWYYEKEFVLVKIKAKHRGFRT